MSAYSSAARARANLDHLAETVDDLPADDRLNIYNLLLGVASGYVPEESWRYAIDAYLKGDTA